MASGPPATRILRPGSRLVLLREHRAVAADGPRFVEGRVGAADQLLGAVPVKAAGDPGRAGLAGGQLGAQPFNGRVNGRHVVACQQQRELLAAEACEKVAGADERAPGARRLPQEPVAGGVPVRVVEALDDRGAVLLQFIVEPIGAVTHAAMAVSANGATCFAARMSLPVVVDGNGFVLGTTPVTP